MRRLSACLGLLVLGQLACAGPGLFSDGTSVSVGSFTKGMLRRGARLPARGHGYVVPPLWQMRNSNYATDELVDALARAADRVALEYPGAQLGIADLSIRGGGESVLHHSHENGRDADLIYYAVDASGRSAAPADSMPRYPTWDGRALAPLPQQHGVVFASFAPRWFDVARNWALVRALLTDPAIEIQYLFIHRRLKERLLMFAIEHGEDPNLIERAEALLRQPGDSLPHDDHLHVRIFCAADDRALGCQDRGPVRWWRKEYKKMAPIRTYLPEDLIASLNQVLSAAGRRGLSGFVP